jgi:hypothetical protein
VAANGEQRAQRTRVVRWALLLIPALAAVSMSVATALQLRPGGLDDGFAVLAAGPRATAWNPANLGLFPQNSAELVSLRAVVGNNAYSLGEYNKYNGAAWSEDDKRDILDHIGGSQLDSRGRAQVAAFGVSVGHFAFSTLSRAASRAAIPKDLIRFGLFGNPVGETFALSDVDGEGIAYTEFRFSFARPVGRIAARISSLMNDWHAGFTLKLLRGWGYVELLEASGSFTTTDAYITGSGQFRSASATRGGGWGIDFGIAGRIGQRWIGSLAIRDLFARLRWTGDAEEHLTSFAIDKLSLSDIDSDDEEDLIEEDTQTNPLDEITSTLPVIFAAGGAYLGDRLLTSFYLEMATKSDLGGVGTPGLSLGMAWPRARWYVLRGVAGLGGAEGTRIGAGFGLGLGPAQLDVACRTWGTLNPFRSKGIGASLGLGFLF